MEISHSRSRALLLRPAMRQSPRAGAGFSLVELMVAMALSLILLSGVLAIFASSRTTYETTDRLSRIQESGRFALDVIVRDLRAAAYLGCSNPAHEPLANTLNTPNALLWNFARGVEGFDAQGTSWLPALDTSASGAPGAAPGSDVLVVRVSRGDFPPVRVADPSWRMSAGTEPIPVADVSPPLVAAGDVVHLSDCEQHAVFQITANVAGILSHEVGGATGNAPGNATNDLGIGFSGAAELMPVQTVIYYLRAGSTPGGGTSLWRRTSDGTGAEELVEGVESMQILYGVGGVDYLRADEVADWRAVRTVRVALLVRSMSEYGTDVDPEDYRVLDVTIPSPGDRHMRQVFTSTVTIRNHET